MEADADTPVQPDSGGVAQPPRHPAPLADTARHLNVILDALLELQQPMVMRLRSAVQQAVAAALPDTRWRVEPFGSRLYGVPLPTSDADLVVLVELLHSKRRSCETVLANLQNLSSHLRFQPYCRFTSLMVGKFTVRVGMLDGLEADVTMWGASHTPLLDGLAWKRRLDEAVARAQGCTLRCRLPYGHSVCQTARLLR